MTRPPSHGPGGPCLHPGGPVLPRKPDKQVDCRGAAWRRKCNPTSCRPVRLVHNAKSRFTLKKSYQSSAGGTRGRMDLRMQRQGEGLPWTQGSLPL